MSQQGAQAQIGNTGIQAPASNLQHASDSANTMMQPFYAGGGKVADDYSSMLQQQYAQANQGQKSIAPNFDQMFSKYVDVSNSQANQQAGKIGESLGSRGALYSSANLQQQAGLRQNQTLDLANAAAGFQTNLENQRQGAQQIQNQNVQNIMTQQGQLAQGEWGARESAMGLAYQDFLRRSDVPPMAGQIAQWGAGVGTTGAYAK